MALKKHSTPCGTLYVNDGNGDELFYLNNGETICLKGKEAKFVGGSSNELIHWLRHPEFWESCKLFEGLRERKESILVLLKVERIDRWGDNLMLTIVSKAYKEIYSDCINIDILSTEKFKDAWKENPHIRNVYTEIPEDVKYSLVIDLNDTELKFRPDQNKKCSDIILQKAGLYTVNKTPVYQVSISERVWATNTLARIKDWQIIYGISRYSFAKVKEYPYMDELIEQLEKEGITCLILDERDEDGTYKYTFRQMAALIEQCNAVIANDSAALHLAGALKKRVFGIFGNTDGVVLCENYEHAVSISSSICKSQPCWWEVPCLTAASYQEKEALGPPVCLTAIEPKTIARKIIDSNKSIRKILVVMLTYDLLEWTKPALESIRTFHNYDLVVIDNASTDGTQKYLTEKGIPFVSKRCGVAAAQNIGFQKFLDGGYDYVLLLNNDVVLHYDTIDSLVRTMEANLELAGLTSTELERVEPWMVDMERATQKGFETIVGIPTSAYSCTIFRRSIVEKIGLFDEHFTPRYIEDNDYTLRLRIAGGTFAKSRESIYFHAVGAVLCAKEEEQRSRNIHWVKNIEYYWEKWGFRPHDVQDLSLIGSEHYKGKLVADITDYIKKNKKLPLVRIVCKLGGLGDAIFRSILGRELKRKFGEKLKVLYVDPDSLHRILYASFPYIDKVEMEAREPVDFTLDITETEFREEWQEISKYGRIMSARTEIYLNIAGLPTDELKPDYFIDPEYAAWAVDYWKNIPEMNKSSKRIVLAKEGSNKLKGWHGMDELEILLKDAGYNVIVSNKEAMDFRHLAAIIGQADLVISPDSGPSNVAGALNIPVLTLFSNRNGKNFEKMFPSMVALQGVCSYADCGYCDYKVWCSKTEGPYRAKENGLGEPECFKALTVSTVMEKVSEMLWCF